MFNKGHSIYHGYFKDPPTVINVMLNYHTGLKKPQTSALEFIEKLNTNAGKIRLFLVVAMVLLSETWISASKWFCRARSRVSFSISTTIDGPFIPCRSLCSGLKFSLL